MSERIDDELGFHQRALALRAWRQQILAANIANADTPHYKARDIDFKASLQAAMGGHGGRLVPVRTSPRHLAAEAQAPAGVRLLYRTEMQSSVDGNTVDMDVERAAFAENALRYEAGLSFINGMLRTLQSALQGQ
jgi:flagellar basal-body rod protein FlgB